ncbi:hypothetical protein RBQ61_17570 [Sedimentibacter sp. MB35-C1]|nr:hypothetical protein [Sedimentibacter sp. MB35-C1]WMJ77347.1 hypothetical protein RBQ61_17570 [Sedimentibacter sp. MB35-C1]
MSDIGSLPGELIAYGADEVMIMDAPWFKDFNDHIYGEVMLDLVKKYKPEIVLIGRATSKRKVSCSSYFVGASYRTYCRLYIIRNR